MSETEIEFWKQCVVACLACPAVTARASAEEADMAVEELRKREEEA